MNARDASSGNLDPISTSQKKRCAFGAPYFAYLADKSSGSSTTYAISQGCCNHWTCPRCGEIRAKTEYARIVAGASELEKQGHDLWFLTITTKGSGLTVADADAGYLKWTNRLLSAMRADAKRTGQHWTYASVTERQKRGHPHSHFLMTYAPTDLRPAKRARYKPHGDGTGHYEPEDCLLSDWLWKRVKSAGLGKIYDLTKVREIAGASRYVAKYLFKSAMLDTSWPDGWKRVRYAQNWPKLDQKPASDAFVLLSDRDWKRLGYKASMVIAGDDIAYEYATFKLRYLTLVKKLTPVNL